MCKHFLSLKLTTSVLYSISCVSASNALVIKYSVKGSLANSKIFTFLKYLFYNLR